MAISAGQPQPIPHPLRRPAPIYGLGLTDKEKPTNSKQGKADSRQEHETTNNTD